MQDTEKSQRPIQEAYNQLINPTLANLLFHYISLDNELYQIET